MDQGRGLYSWPHQLLYLLFDQLLLLIQQHIYPVWNRSQNLCLQNQVSHQALQMTCLRQSVFLKTQVYLLSALLFHPLPGLSYPDLLMHRGRHLHASRLK